jgi:hypothetical protein
MCDGMAFLEQLKRTVLLSIFCLKVIGKMRTYHAGYTEPGWNM